MANIKDVAKASGYSIGAVSKALNGYADVSEKAREKIQKVANEIGYIPSSFGQTLAKQRSFTIGIVFEEVTGSGLAHPFFSELLSVIKNEIEMNGYDILLLGKKVGPFVNSYLDHCIKKGVDGVIVLSGNIDEINYQQLVNSNIPMVLIDANNENKNTIGTNNFTSTFNLVNYLKNLGHKKIGYIKGDLYSYVGKERYDGYLEAMRENNLEINENYLYHAPKYTYAEGEWIAKDIAKNNDYPTAIISVCDATAIGLMKGLAEYNINVPNDISIVGFDDIALARVVYPSLTTLSQNKEEIGKLAVSTLVHNIDNKMAEQVHYLLDGIIIERNSVKNLN